MHMLEIHFTTNHLERSQFKGGSVRVSTASMISL
uniref:Uncharacterized protein n=1 Tax=Rhizophora mucronata TaxID=61149 RepID=A0A2P2PM36_RHIMU